MQKIDIAYAPAFVRRYKKLPHRLREEVKERIALFRDPENHERLAVHKLKGSLRVFYSFSANYQYRVIFEYTNNKSSASLLDIDDHEVYER